MASKAGFKFSKLQQRVDELGELKQQLKALEVEISKKERLLRNHVGEKFEGMHFKATVYSRDIRTLSKRRILKLITQEEFDSCYRTTGTCTVVSIKER